MAQPAYAPPPWPPRRQEDHPHKPDNINGNPTTRTTPPTASIPNGADVTARSSLLGVPERWHPLLFVCRLLSTVPAVWWGFPIALRLLLQLYLLVSAVVGYGPAGRLGVAVGGGDGGGGDGGGGGGGLRSAESSFESRLRLMETLLAIIWCGASAYLSFFFTDCLMSRWLLNYTPQATLVRLLTINALNGYLTSWVLFLTGGSEDPRLFLPAWIAIATTLTMLYHVTQRKINIRKETSMTISVFSIASFISMVALLGQLHLNRSDYPNVPLFSLARKAWHQVGKLAVKVVEYGNVTREL
ncbi:N-glycosylation protein-domain-containing protein [Phialemonium atrogriseum]|uniref:N-glycosylation protein-domain-containing protein n=1 Tax=Phialemonium atrogriseum TaxID=1093897 RepID=A0AAJ0C6V3_9PEZI|nr:N-glycosylation protein-domain-containing protein [Phialemonium atrogriseum]KAK1768756.1 N-glycosylation protein-domain-containing protein [Phialemonium atrogriseum]